MLCHGYSTVPTKTKNWCYFFVSIPDSSHLKAVNNVANASSIQLIEKMTEALLGFIHRTLTSNLVAQEVKKWRLDICRKAMITAPFVLLLLFFFLNQFIYRGSTST